MSRSAPQLVLASSSPYRRVLLEKLGLPFTTASPDIDETPLPGESPHQLVHRLAEQKALALRERFPGSWIIGSDQAACLNGLALGKPGDFDRAFAQLQACSGRRVEFVTGLSLLDGNSGRVRTAVETFAVEFRTLTAAQIRDYLEREQPFDCAGSFKAEGLGIALFERMDGDDPNTLIGLPLIRLVSFLNDAGLNILAN